MSALAPGSINDRKIVHRLSNTEAEEFLRDMVDHSNIIEKHSYGNANMSRKVL